MATSAAIFLHPLLFGGAYKAVDTLMTFPTALPPSMLLSS